MLADAVVAPPELLVAVEAETEAAPFLHLGLGQALHGPALDGSCRWRCRGRRDGRSRKHRAWWRRLENPPLVIAASARKRARRRGTLIAELQLAGEAHGDGKGLRVVDLDVEAERRLESRGEELHLLRLRQVTRPRE